MSIKLQMDIERCLKDVQALSEKIDKGLTEHADKKFEEVMERLKKMEEKYHMLNARLSKYKVD